MKIIKIIAVFCCLLILYACSDWKRYNYHLQPHANNEIRVMTYNVNWGEGYKTIQFPEKTLEAIKKSYADVILLQETTSDWEKKIRSSLAKRYKYIVFKHFPHAGGLAVLSKIPFKTVYYGETGVGWHPFWIIAFKFRGKPIQMVNLHLSPSLVAEGNPGIFAHALFTTGGKRRKEMQIIFKHLKLTLPTIIAGDFNEGKTGYAIKWLKARGFKDAIEVSQNLLHTWEWDIGFLNFHDQFDRIFYNKKIHLINLQIVHWGDSDHFPVIANLK